MAPSNNGLIEPVTPEWVIGSLSVGVDEEAGLIFVTAEEMLADDGDVPGHGADDVPWRTDANGRAAGGEQGALA